jgi:glycosyltransferase involved in cell wall biosynthesis
MGRSYPLLPTLLRILSLSHTYPWPPDNGSRVRISNMLTRLAGRHDVVLLTSGSPGGVEPRDVGGLRVEVLRDPQPSHRLGARVLRNIQAIVRGKPSVTLAGDAPLRRRVADWCRLDWPDVLVAEENDCADLLREAPERVPRIWVKHSIQLDDAREVSIARGRRTPMDALRGWSTRRFERRNMKGSTAVVALTDEDGARLRSLYPGTEVVVVKNGVDRALFPFRPDPETHVVGFVGDMTWQANIDAVGWFLAEIWPRVRTRAPDATFRVIGRGAEPGALRGSAHGGSAQEGLVWAGYVGSVAEAVADVSVGVVPVRIGSGIRCKLLEFFSMGIASVVTPLGAQGVDVREGVHAIVAANAGGFADGVVALLSDPAARRRLAGQARRLAAEADWDARAAELESLLRRVSSGS